MNKDQERNGSLDHKETLYLKENPSIAGFIWPPTINKPIAIPQVLDYYSISFISVSTMNRS